MNKKDWFIELGCKLNNYFRLWKILCFISVVYWEIIVEHLCLLNRTFSKSLIQTKIFSTKLFGNWNEKTGSLWWRKKNYSILNICLLVILFLDYVINEQDTNKFFFMQSGLLNGKCTCWEIILIPSPNINQRRNIFYRIRCAS